MKFLLCVAAVIAVAVAVPTQRGLVTPVAAGPAPVILPEDVTIVDSFEPIAIGPAIIDAFEPIAIGPAIIDFPLPEPVSVGPAIIDFPVPGAVTEPIVAPSPVSIVPGPAAEVTSGTPLVQIILNINQAAADVSPIAVGPAITPEAVEVAPTPVSVVEVAPTPVHVVDEAPVPVTPVQVVEVAPVPVEPVQVVEVAPIAVEPVIIGTPIIPAPAVILPEELN